MKTKIFIIAAFLLAVTTGVYAGHGKCSHGPVLLNQSLRNIESDCKVCSSKKHCDKTEDQTCMKDKKACPLTDKKADCSSCECCKAGGCCADKCASGDCCCTKKGGCASSDCADADCCKSCDICLKSEKSCGMSKEKKVKKMDKEEHGCCPFSK